MKFNLPSLVAILFLGCSVLWSCGDSPEQEFQSDTLFEIESKIISLNPTSTELLFALNLQGQLVGRDVRSTNPSGALLVPEVGNSHTFSAEGLLSFSPTDIIIAEKDCPSEMLNTLNEAGVNIVLIEEPQSLKQTKSLLNQLAVQFDANNQAIQQIEQELNCAETKAKGVGPKGVFIYAHGGGNMMVAGGNTAVQTMFELAGLENTAQNIDGFKPLTSEALVAFQPDLIVMFEHSIQTLSTENLWAYPGMEATPAGRTKRILVYPAHQMNSFGLGTCAFVKTFEQDIKTALDE